VRIRKHEINTNYFFVDATTTRDSPSSNRALLPVLKAQTWFRVVVRGRFQASFLRISAWALAKKIETWPSQPQPPVLDSTTTDRQPTIHSATDNTIRAARHTSKSFREGRLRFVSSTKKLAVHISANTTIRRTQTPYQNKPAHRALGEKGRNATI
jgi:hypothetical protein